MACHAMESRAQPSSQLLPKGEDGSLPCRHVLEMHVRSSLYWMVWLQGQLKTLQCQGHLSSWEDCAKCAGKIMAPLYDCELSLGPLLLVQLSHGEIYTAERCVGFFLYQVFEDMLAWGVQADVVTCCSLITALERGGQWSASEQLFCQMCRARCRVSFVVTPGRLQARSY